MLIFKRRFKDMGKESHIDYSARIIKALEKAGIKGVSVTIKIDPQIEKDVREYVMEKEDGHREAAGSTLTFRNPLFSALQPSNS